MSNKIQIKRSVANAVVTGLSNGELAFTQNSNVLYIGAPDGSGNSIPIGGERNPGVLTANQALVANSSSAIDQIIVGKAIFTGATQTINVGGSVGTAGYLLASNSTSNAYWLDPATLSTNPAGSNTQVQFNDSGTFGATANLTYNKATDTFSAINISGNGASVTSVNAIALGGKTEGSLNVNSALTANLATYINANSGLISNSSGVFVHANDGIVANTLGVFVNTAYIGTLTANLATYINANSGIISNSSGVFADGANGISVDGSGINVLAGTNGGLSVNSSGVWVTGGTGVTVNSTGVSIGQDVSTTSNVTFANIVTTDLSVNGNTALGSNTQDVVSFNAQVNTNINPSANVTYSLGTNILRWNEGHFANVHSSTGYFDGNVQVGGDIIVSGNLVTTNVSSVVISDPLIYLAGNNYTSDLVDIGFAGNYNNGSANVHTGLFRHAADDTYYLFKGLTQELDNVLVVNVADPTFTIADLTVYLKSGALTSNSTTVTITANSTVNVNITANTLALSTALAATSGGTGTGSYTSGDILVANTGNALSKLSLGTSGYVLQSNGTALVYDVLDGGSF